MNEILQHLSLTAKERWHTKTGLTAALLLVVTALIVTFAGIDIGEVSIFEWVIVVLAGSGLALAWAKTRVPRTAKQKIGFAIALSIEDSPSASNLRSDFVLALRDLIARSSLRYDFQFIELSKSICIQIVDDDSAKRIAEQGRYHFLLWGRARLRQLPGGSSHVIDLRGVVRHAKLGKAAGDNFAQEFGSVFPDRVIVDASDGLFGCEVAAKHLDAVARLVIGTAAYLSGDFGYAEQLLKDAEAKITSYLQGDKATYLSVPLERVHSRLRELYLSQLRHAEHRFLRQRDLTVLRDSEPILAKLRSYYPGSYEACLYSAICCFLIRRDIAGARKEIEACRQEKDATWRYSEAFLNLYVGDLDAAYGSYQKAFRSPLKNRNVPTQSEEFIQLILDEEPEKTWLNFGLGLINQRAKVDLPSANRDFKAFLIGTVPGKYSTQVNAAKKWLSEMKEE